MVKNFVGVFLLLLSISLVVAAPCLDDDDIILKLYRDQNSHAALWDSTSGYDVGVCYSDVFGREYPFDKTGIHDCASKTPILWLYDTFNSHVSNRSTTTYDTPICYGDLTCNVRATCLAGETEVLKVSSGFNAHASLAGQSPTYDTLCCVSGTVTPVKDALWQDSSGSEITKSRIGNKVRLVVTNTGLSEGTTVSMEIRTFDDTATFNKYADIRVGSEAIVGTVSSGVLVGEWEITTEDYQKANNPDHFYFTASIGGVDETSGPLDVSNRDIDEPLVVKLLNPPCGENYVVDEVLNISVFLGDDDDTIEGQIRVNGQDIGGKITNGWNWTLYELKDSGNIQVEVYAKTPGEELRVISSIMVVDPSSEGFYLAACIGEPKDLAQIPSGRNVPFSAKETRGLVNKSGALYEVGKEDMRFFWKFSSGSNPYTDGVNKLSYEFHKNFQTPGRNWATLDVELKDNPTHLTQI